MSGPLQQLLLCSVQVMIHWKPVMLHPADVSQKSTLLYAAKLPVTAQLPRLARCLRIKILQMMKGFLKRSKMIPKYESTEREKVQLLYPWSSLGWNLTSQSLFPLLTSRGRHPDSTGLIIQPILQACCQDDWREKSYAEVFTLHIGRKVGDIS